jgi:hypothetical protein
VTLPDRDFLWEHRAYSLHADSPLEDLVHAYGYLQDRFTPDYLPVAGVSGGMLALKVRGERRGSVWFWSDDDPRASDEDTPADTERLLYFCGESWDAFLERLEVPEPITDQELEEFIRHHDVRLEIGPAGDAEPEQTRRRVTMAVPDPPRERARPYERRSRSQRGLVGVRRRNSRRPPCRRLAGWRPT